jgi:hypothetical protein
MKSNIFQLINYLEDSILNIKYFKKKFFEKNEKEKHF